MVLASLFLMWGREALHLTQLLVEPVYFVSGLNFPVGRLGLLGAAGDRDHPARGRPGRDAPARVRRAAVPGRHAAARGGGADPRRDDRRVRSSRPRWMLVALERRARREGRLSVRWQ